MEESACEEATEVVLEEKGVENIEDLMDAAGGEGDVQLRLEEFSQAFQENMEGADALTEDFLQEIQNLLESYHSFYSMKRVERANAYESLAERIAAADAENKDIEKSIEYIMGISTSMYAGIQSVDGVEYVKEE